MIRVFWAYRDIPTVSGFIIRGFIWAIPILIFAYVLVWGPREVHGQRWNPTKSAQPVQDFRVSEWCPSGAGQILNSVEIGLRCRV